MSNALLNCVIPYFGVPQRHLSERGQEFMRKVLEELLKALGIQCVLTSPYHPEGNAINKRSHRTMNNMLHALLYDGIPAPHWVNEIAAIILTLKSMPHQPHRYLASVIATHCKK